jgi:protein ImuB
VAAGCEPGEPVAVVHANRVVARSFAAAQAGVLVGQRRREAQSRCPQVRLVSHEPARDVRAFLPVVDAVAAMVPRLELTEPGVLTFATRGPSRYFGGDHALAVRVQALVGHAVGRQCAAAGQPAVGIADGRFAAGVAARHGVRAAATGGSEHATHVVGAGDSADFLAPLSLTWLIEVGGVTVNLVGLLRRLGLADLAALAALPVADVLARFGTEGVVAQRMAAGGDDRLPGTEDPPEGMVFVHRFDTPVQHLDTLVFAGKNLAEQLAEALAGQGRVCTQLLVAAETEHGERTERYWSRGTGLSASAMVERIRWQLDGWAQQADVAITAGVVQLRLEPTEVRADDGVQLRLWGGRTRADEWAQRATARLVGLVGDEHVVVPQWQGGRHPGDAYRWVPAVHSDLTDGSTRRTAAPGSSAVGPWPGSLPMPSPSAVYPSATPAVVTDSREQPVWVSGRGVSSGAPAVVRHDGVVEHIAAWAGPWVVDERWWDAVRHRRVARFQLLTTSGRAYLAVIERQQWWLVAEYS